MVRDALTMGPRRGEDAITPHTRPPADDDGDHMLVRTVLCLEGEVEIELVCEPVFDYGRAPAEWTLVDGDRHTADATGAGQTIRLQTDMALGIEGNRVRARHMLQQGEQALLRAVVGRGPGAPDDVDEAHARLARDDALLARLARAARALPDHRWREPIQRSALTIKGLTYMPTGATVAALTTSLPETPGGERNWDYRFTWMRDSTFTLQALHFLNLDWEADEFMQFVADLEPNEDGGAPDHVRDRRSAGPDRVDARRPLRVRGRAARCGSATARSTSARTTCSARCSTRSCCTPAAASGCRAACGRSSRRRPSAPRRSGASPTRGSGRRAASRSTTCRRSSCAGWRWTAPRSWPTSAATRSCTSLGRDGGRDPGGHPRARRQGRRPAPALRDRRAGCLDPAGGDLRLPAARRRAPPRERARDRRRPDRGRVRAALPHRRDRRRPVGQGGHVPDLLVLAGLGARDHRRGAARPRPDGAAAARRVAAGALRRGVRHRDRPPPRQLPAGVLAPRADRGGRADHRRGGLDEFS